MTNNNENNRLFLAPITSEIAEVVGLEAALKISEKYGGSHKYIPAKLCEDHWLAKTIGFEKAQILCEHFRVGNSGQMIGLQVNPHGSQGKRILAETLLVEGELSVDEIARTVKLHRTTLFRYKNNIRHLIPDSKKEIEARKAKIDELFANGASPETVANETGLSMSAIRKHMQRLGITTPPKSKTQKGKSQ